MLRTCLVLTGLACCAALPLRAQSVLQSSAGSASARVDSVFARYRGSAAPGCVVGVRQAGTEVLTRAYGSANLEAGTPLTAQSILEAGSVSKQFTAAIIVLLAADGTLSLDDPVRKHVPELGPFADSIRLRHLLSHTSGLRDWGSLAALAGWPRGLRAHTHAHVLAILAQQRRLNFPPGTEYSYSNSGYNLLAMIAERVSGKTLEQLSREQIFAPLGMTSTQWRDDFTEIVPGRAVAYSAAPDGYRLDMPFESVYGNGGLLTTVEDLLRWSENFRPGSPTYGRVGGRALVDVMQRRAVLASGDTITYALGLMVGAFRGVPEVSHSGATAGYRAFLARYPRENLSVALLCNRGDANPGTLAHAVASAYLGSALRGPEPSVAVAPERLAERVGLYRDTTSGDLLRVTMRDGRLREGFAGQGAELVPASSERLRIGGGELRWEPPRSGSPARLWLSGARGRTIEYTLVPPAAPPASALAAYEGTYTSGELGVSYTVRSSGNRLQMQLAPAEPVTLEPLDADAFRAGSRFIRFTRDGAATVNGFELTTDRVYRLRFDR